MLTKILGYFLLVVLCILAGVYADSLNPSRSIEFPGMNFSLAGLVVGIGMGFVVAAIILLAMGEKAEENLENAEVPNDFIHYLRNSLQVMSRHKASLVAMLIAGLIPVAYGIARPLYLMRPFKPHIPEYLELAAANAPQDNFPVEGTFNPEEEDHSRDLPLVQPDFGGNAAEEVTRETHAREEKLAMLKAPVPSNLPVKGKIMPVDVTKQIIDPVFLDLSSDLLPSRPEEVGSIAALWWWEMRVGRYGSGGDSDTHGAFQQHCIVMVWDKSTKSLLAKQHFVGGRPPKTSIVRQPRVWKQALCRKSVISSTTCRTGKKPASLKVKWRCYVCNDYLGHHPSGPAGGICSQNFLISPRGSFSTRVS